MNSTNKERFVLVEDTDISDDPIIQSTVGQRTDIKYAILSTGQTIIYFRDRSPLYVPKPLSEYDEEGLRDFAINHILSYDDIIEIARIEEEYNASLISSAI